MDFICHMQAQSPSTFIIWEKSSVNTLQNLSFGVFRNKVKVEWMMTECSFLGELSLLISYAAKLYESWWIYHKQIRWHWSSSHIIYMLKPLASTCFLLAYCKSED